jgi:RHS repeat-associated protein
VDYTSTCAQNYKFEGKERDTETENDDFGARYYSWRFGRWLSSDWSAVPVAVPYANLTNPQTLNLYSMVGDDPESFADLDGHWEDQRTPGYNMLGEPISTPVEVNDDGSPEGQYAQQVADGWAELQRQAANNEYAGQVPDRAQNNGNDPQKGGGLVYKSTPDSIDVKGLVKSFLGLFGIQFGSTPAADTNTPQEIPLPANLLWIDKIANGHGWTDHGQDDFSSKQEYKQAILDTVQNANGKDVQRPDKFRTLFWNDSEGFAVWRDKRHPDQGTAYFPDNPDAFKKKWGLE